MLVVSPVADDPVCVEIPLVLVTEICLLLIKSFDLFVTCLFFNVTITVTLDSLALNPVKVTEFPFAPSVNLPEFNSSVVPSL